LLDSSDIKMVLRLNGTSSALPGTDRSNEISIWQAAAANGIAPPLIYHDEEHGFLVSTYIDNSLPGKPPFDQTYINHAFDLLNRCHQLEIDTQIINYSDHIEHYWHIIESKNRAPNPQLKAQRKPMQLMLEELLASGTEVGLCHHDPVIANFVGQPERLYLIDWEYAARGLVIMDYSALAAEWKIDDVKVVEQTGVQADLLNMAKALYQYLCDLWEEVTAQR
jgi:thiamine kinase